MDPERFRHVTAWLRNVIKRKLPGQLQKEVDYVLEGTEPWEVGKML
jgi:hypothetical protein